MSEWFGNQVYARVREIYNNVCLSKYFLVWPPITPLFRQPYDGVPS